MKKTCWSRKRIVPQEFSTRLRAYCWKILFKKERKKREDANDLMQDVFEKLVRAGRLERHRDGTLVFRGEEGSRLEATEEAVRFAIVVARNRFLDLVRRGNSEKGGGGTRVVSLDEERDFVSASEGGPLTNHVPAFDGQLTQKDRDILMRLWNDFPNGLTWLSAGVADGLRTLPEGAERDALKKRAGDLTGLRVLLEAFIPLGDSKAPAEWRSLIHRIRRDRAMAAASNTGFIAFLQELQGVTSKKQKTALLEKYERKLLRWAVKGPAADRDGDESK